MLYGLGLSAAGGQLARVRAENTSNNLANAKTVGFKQDLLSVMQRPVESQTWLEPWQGPARAPYGDPLLDSIGGGVWLHRTFTDHTTGQISMSGNDYDFALEGKGIFFRVQEDQSGDIRYTRAGNFHENSEGMLMTGDGSHNVLDTEGNTINVRELIADNGNGRFEVNRDGQIIIVNDNASVPTGTFLAVTHFHDAALEGMDKLGNNMWGATEEGLEDEGQLLSSYDDTERASIGKVHHRFVELSGANPIDQMVKMVEANRAFEQNINMMSLQNSSLQSLISDVGRPM